MTEEQVLRKAEQLALGIYLTAWREDVSYRDTLVILEQAQDEYPDGFVPWEPFEYWKPSDLGDEIDGTRAAIFLAFQEVA